MPNTNPTNIFYNGSRTYFWTSLFFPKKVRDDVFALYAFVRIADDYVDAPIPNLTEYYALKKAYRTALKHKKISNSIVEAFVELSTRRKFDPQWTEAFFSSMDMDIEKPVFLSLEDTLIYIHGSAEVVGLMMACVLRLPKKSYKGAQLLGRSMQYINFIRDIDEDVKLERSYFPEFELRRFGIEQLDAAYIKSRQERFVRFVQAQLAYYREWEKEASLSFKLIPRRKRIPIVAAANLYNWTARQIEKNPMIIYERKVKPSLPRIFWEIGKACMR